MKENSKIHLGIIYIGRKGGICQYTYELVRVISKIVKVTCYLSANNIMLDRWRELPCQIKTFDTYNGFPSLIWSMVYQAKPSSVARAIEADRPDILLDTGSGPWAGIIKKAIVSKPLLVDAIHDVEPHPDRWSFLLKAYHSIYPNHADVLVGISDYSCKKMVSKFPGVKIIKSLHGIIHSSSSIDLDKIAKNRNKFLFLGRIERYKGVDVIVEAFRIAKQECADISLAVVGQGPINKNLKEQMLRLDIQLINRWISDEELSKIVADYGVILLPYLSATQSGVAAVALGNGLSAIATDVGALPEQIINNKNGAIVPPNDANALARAMVDFSKKDYASAYKMAEESCLLASTTYSWKKIGNNLVRDLIDIAKKKDVPY